MKTLVHLSDLHFGTVDAELVEPLRAAVRDAKPDVVVVSGDLTQRATSEEFEQAKAFLETLPSPQVVVPGNHDLSFFNYWRRVTEGLGRYRQHITDDLTPFHADGEIAVLGVNTARVSAVRGGRFRAEALQEVERRFAPLPAGVVRVLVTHHPFDFQDTLQSRHLIKGAREGMARLVARVDLLLAGHMHLSHAGHTARRYQVAGQSAVFVQAGTALSYRRKGEANAFQVLRVREDEIGVERLTWSAERSTFFECGSQRFRRTEAGWAEAV